VQKNASSSKKYNHLLDHQPEAIQDGQSATFLNGGTGARAGYCNWPLSHISVFSFAWESSIGIFYKAHIAAFYKQEQQNTKVKIIRGNHTRPFSIGNLP
jgi:hypothetical protein